MNKTTSYNLNKLFHNKCQATRLLGILPFIRVFLFLLLIYSKFLPR